MYYLAWISNLEKYGPEYQHKNSNHPLYMAASMKRVNLEFYEPHKLGYWTSFSTVSGSRDFAIEVCRTSRQEQIVLFEVYTSTENSPATNVQIPPSWSFIPGHREVLLFPMFGFLVVSITHDYNLNLIIIKLVEVPY